MRWHTTSVTPCAIAAAVPTRTGAIAAGSVCALLVLRRLATLLGAADHGFDAAYKLSILISLLESYAALVVSPAQAFRER